MSPDGLKSSLVLRFPTIVITNVNVRRNTPSKIIPLTTLHGAKPFHKRGADFVSRIDPVRAIGRIAKFVSHPSWGSPAARDGVFLFVALALTWAAFEEYDLPPEILSFALRHEDWHLDDAVAGGIVVAAGLLVFTWRRLRELRREVSARRKAEATAQKLARHDPPTGLPNRRFFNERLEQTLSTIVGEGSRAAVLMLDLDGFKAKSVHPNRPRSRAALQRLRPNLSSSPAMKPRWASASASRSPRTTAPMQTSWCAAPISRSTAPRPTAARPPVFSSRRWTPMSSGAAPSSVSCARRRAICNSFSKSLNCCCNCRKLALALRSG